MLPSTAVRGGSTSPSRAIVAPVPTAAETQEVWTSTP